MKIFVVLCMVTVGLATRLHHRENLDTWTKIGDSYFKVFDGPSDWDTAQSNCEDVSGSINIGDEIVKRATGHLAYDKNCKIHAFLKAQFEEDSTCKLQKHSLQHYIVQTFVVKIEIFCNSGVGL